MFFKKCKKRPREIVSKIFLSHSHDDKAIAKRFERLLRRCFGLHLQIFNSSKKTFGEYSSRYVEMEDGTIYSCYLQMKSDMQQAINESSVIIVIVTKNSIRSEFVKFEVDAQKDQVFEPAIVTPVYGAVLGKDKRKLIAELYDEVPYSIDEEAANEQGNIKSAITVTLEKPDWEEEVKIKPTFYDISQGFELEKLFKAIEASIGINPIKRINWNKEAAKFKKYIKTTEYEAKIHRLTIKGKVPMVKGLKASGDLRALTITWAAPSEKHIPKSYQFRYEVKFIELDENGDSHTLFFDMSKESTYQAPENAFKFFTGDLSKLFIRVDIWGYDKSGPAGRYPLEFISKTIVPLNEALRK